MTEDRSVKKDPVCLTAFLILGAYVLFVVSAYGLVDGILRPDDMAFARNPGSEVDIQPETFFMQLGSWLMALFLNVASGGFIYFKLKKL
jgi:hypothetical protein